MKTDRLPWEKTHEKRKCLKCQKIFPSAGSHNRICQICLREDCFGGMSEKFEDHKSKGEQHEN